jgi:ATP-dependent exoDNAse (exonuclease V) beta subunit
MIDPPLRLSQGHLQLLVTCPPQFQRLYLEQLTTPIPPEQQEKLDWGDRFHRLMQQRELGLPVKILLDQYPDLAAAFSALIQAVPALQNSPPHPGRRPEHYLSLPWQNYLLTVIYDLLVTEPDRAEILDWKTYLLPQNPEKILLSWQTKLYLYVLAETGVYEPEQLSMTYWFVKLSQTPQSLTIAYSQKQHQETRQELERLLTQLNQWLSPPDRSVPVFPHQTDCQSRCPYRQHFPLVSQEVSLLTRLAAIPPLSP